MPDLRKDADNHWLSSIPIDEALWKRLIDGTRSGIIAQLQFIDRQLRSGNPPKNDLTILAGNYSFAVEEYGKLLLLKGYAPFGGKVTIRYAKEIRSHIKKFDTAIANLPRECAILQEGAFDSNVFDPGAFQTEIRADFESRLAIFYSDITEDLKDVVQTPSVDSKVLTLAVKTLTGIVEYN